MLTNQSLQEAMAAVKYEAKWHTAPKLEDLGAAHERSNRANSLYDEAQITFPPETITHDRSTRSTSNQIHSDRQERAVGI
jgi:hypothetical protein